MCNVFQIRADDWVRDLVRWLGTSSRWTPKSRMCQQSKWRMVQSFYTHLKFRGLHDSTAQYTLDIRIPPFSKWTTLTSGTSVSDTCKGLRTVGKAQRVLWKESNFSIIKRRKPSCTCFEICPTLIFLRKKLHRNEMFAQRGRNMASETRKFDVNQTHTFQTIYMPILRNWICNYGNLQQSPQLLQHGVSQNMTHKLMPVKNWMSSWTQMCFEALASL